MSLRRTLWVGGLLALAPAVYGQGLDDGSLYSRYGLGELQDFSSSRARAMGGGGTALYNFDYVNFSNPGAWSRQALVRIAAGLQFDGLRASDAAGSSERVLRGTLGAVQMGVPLLAGRLGMGFAYAPFSRVNYQVTTSGLLDAGIGDPLSYITRYEGSGGLRQVRGGLGFQAVPGVSVGVSADVVFGITEEGRRTTFDSINYLRTNLQTRTRLHGVGWSAGTVLSKEWDQTQLSIAVSASMPATLIGNQTTTLGESLDSDTLGTVLRGDVALPVRISGGVAVHLQRRWLVMADVRYEPWTDATSTIPLNGFETGFLRDRLRISGGVELVPAGSSLLEGYLARTAYRIGFYRDNLYSGPVPGMDIAVTALTGGLGLPTLFAGTRMDLSFVVGVRGTTDPNLIRDRTLGVSAVINVGERWFVKRRLG